MRILVEHGVVGLMLYLYLVIIIVRLKTHSLLVLKVAKSVLILIFMQGMFSYPNMSMPIMFLATIALSLLMRVSYHQKVINVNVKSIIIISLTFLLFSFKSYFIYHRFFVCITDENVSVVEKRNKVCCFFDYLQNDNAFLTSFISMVPQTEKRYIFAINKLKKTHPSPFVLIKEGDYWSSLNKFDEAEKAYLLASSMVPSKQEPRVKLAILYKHMGLEEKGNKLAKKILKESVKTYSFKTYELHEILKKEFKLE